MTQDLHEQNRLLRRKLTTYLAQAKANEEKLARLHSQELHLISARGFEDLIRIITLEYRQSAELDAVSLCLVDPGHELRHILADLGVNFDAWPALSFVDRPADLAHLLDEPGGVSLRRFNAQRHAGMFAPPCAELQSVALLPLQRAGNLIGFLCLGSTDPARYGPGSATDLLERLAAFVAVSLENATNQERVKRLGLVDPLTGVHNRRYFDQRLAEEVHSAQRSTGPLSCLFLDIDRFKSINDAHGHAAGDAVLLQAAALIKQQLRASDVLARFGGEEFVALLAQTGRTRATEVAERVRRAVAEHQFALPGHKVVEVTLSAGSATIGTPLAELTVEEGATALLQTADAALYRAKQQGRNRVVCDEVPAPRHAKNSPSLA